MNIYLMNIYFTVSHSVVSTLVTPRTVCRLPDSSVHGILQVGLLKWVTIPFSRVSSRTRDRTWVSHIAAGSLFVIVQSLGCVQHFATPWTAATSTLCFTISWSFLKFMSIDSVMLSNHLILCYPFLLLPSIFPSIGSFLMSWFFASGDQSFTFSISPSSEYSGLISFRINWFDLLAVQETINSLLHTTVQKHQFFSTQPSFGPTLTSVHEYWKNHSSDYTDLYQQSDVFAS